MDNLKDNNKDMSDTSVIKTEVKDNGPIDYFSKNESFVFVYKKTEKLATALYMVTNLFGDSEPMKWSLRSKVSSLLSFIIGFKDVVGARVDEFSNDVKTQVLEIVSLLEIASRSGLVSNMNFSILRTEFMYMITFLADSKNSSFHRANLGQDFFNIGQTVRINQPKSLSDAKPIISKYVSDGATEAQVSDSLSDKVPSNRKYSNRQNIIINLLKRKKEIVIQDVAKVITDCSEKTIQRELISLVEQEVIKRTGERRWSKYSLVNTEGNILGNTLGSDGMSE